MSELLTVDGERTEWVLNVVVRQRHRAAVADAVWRELRDVAAGGPPESELAAVVELFRRGREAVLAESGEPDSDSDTVFWDVPVRSLRDELATLSALTPAVIADLAAKALPTTLVVVPDGVHPDLPGVTEDRCPTTPTSPEGRVLRRRLRHGLWSTAARRERLILTPDGVCRVDPEGGVHIVRFADVLMVEGRGRARTVHGRHGCVVDVDPERFSGTRRAVRAIDAAGPVRRRLHLS
jgi:hypothetical protein